MPSYGDPGPVSPLAGGLTLAVFAVLLLAAVSVLFQRRDA